MNEFIKEIESEATMNFSAHRHRIVAALILASLFSAGALAIDVAPPGADRAAPPKPLPPGGGPNGALLFQQRCATCHDPQVDRAPSKQQLMQYWSDQIVTALTNGKMQPYGIDAGMTLDEIDAVATHLGGLRPPIEIPRQANPPDCPADGKRFSMSGPSWNGWSPTAENLRYQEKPNLNVQDVPRLQVKWAFTFIGGRYGQPTAVGGRIFVSSSAGKVYSLDAKTGCAYWRFDATNGVRTTLVIGKNSASPSGYAAYFGSYDRIYYAVDAATGAKLWETSVEKHLRQVLTGSPVLYKDRLIVPVSAWEEVGSAGANYQCCTARGSIAALDIKTGAIIWQTYTLPEAKAYKLNSVKRPMFGPAGASIWSTPTVDAKRKSIYITTGDAFVDAPEDGSDSVMALNADTGAFRWKRQFSKEDVYLAGCPKVKKADSPPNCPEKNGPDSDFGASAFLMKGAKHKDILVAGQKSSHVYALNPDTGELVWETKLGKGSALGGVEWGMTTDKKLLFAPNADIAGGTPGLHALDPATGKTVWYTAAPKVRCAWQAPGATNGTVCVNGASQAASTIPGAIFSGTMDGHMRAYDSKTGAILWDFDTAAHKYDTVNGYKDLPGGALDAGGPIIVDGMMYVMSGYNSNLGGVTQNVLLAFSVDGK